MFFTLPNSLRQFFCGHFSRRVAHCRNRTICPCPVSPRSREKRWSTWSCPSTGGKRRRWTAVAWWRGCRAIRWPQPEPSHKTKCSRTSWLNFRMASLWWSAEKNPLFDVKNFYLSFIWCEQNAQGPVGWTSGWLHYDGQHKKIPLFDVNWSR